MFVAILQVKTTVKEGGPRHKIKIIIVFLNANKLHGDPLVA